MSTKKGLIGILTGGGDVSGLNPAIRSLAVLQCSGLGRFLPLLCRHHFSAGHRHFAICSNDSSTAAHERDLDSPNGARRDVSYMDALSREAETPKPIGKIDMPALSREILRGKGLRASA